MKNTTLPLIAAFGLVACQPAQRPADPVPAEETAPAPIPAPQAVTGPAEPAASPAPAAPTPSRAAPARTAVKPAEAPAQPPTPPTAPAPEPMTDHSGHDMSAMPAPPKQ